MAAEEDVHRTLPFFGTALGIVIGALAYAAGRLPHFAAVATRQASVAYDASAVLLGLAIFEAVCVLVFLSRATARRGYQRIGPEPFLRARMKALQASHDIQAAGEAAQDREMAKAIRAVLLDSYTAVTPVNRELNRRRQQFRALASSHMVRSLIWALGATTVIFLSDKFGYLPGIGP